MHFVHYWMCSSLVFNLQMLQMLKFCPYLAYMVLAMIEGNNPTLLSAHVYSLFSSSKNILKLWKKNHI